MSIQQIISFSGREVERAARFIVWALRHAPEKAGLSMNAQGWVKVEDLLKATKVGKSGARMTHALLDQVVASDSKQRLERCATGLMIRAAQGHSVEIDLTQQRAEPPMHLYHGTATRNIDAIRRSGLLRGKRQHVHLSLDADTAIKVGARHGAPVVLRLRAAELSALGVVFLRASNGVWLCEHAPASHIDWDCLIYPFIT